jgi:hypothetical protein
MSLSGPSIGSISWDLQELTLVTYILHCQSIMKLSSFSYSIFLLAISLAEAMEGTPTLCMSTPAITAQAGSIIAAK